MRRYSIAVLLIFALLVSVGCGSGSGPDSALSSRLADLVAQGPGAQFSLGDLTDFKWDHLWIFAPYTTTTEIDKALGFQWPAASLSRIGSDDGICLLVFVSGQTVVRYAEHPRDHGDMAELTKKGPWAPTDRFIVRRVDRGGPWLVLEPTRIGIAP